MAVKTCPSASNGGSTGRPPIHVRRIALVVMIQNMDCLRG